MIIFFKIEEGEMMRNFKICIRMVKIYTCDVIFVV